MKLDLINIILFIAAAQGIFLTVLIFHKYRGVYANRYLGTLLFFYSLILLNLNFEDLGIYGYIPYILILSIAFPLLIGPLYFFYARGLISTKKQFKKNDWLHFVPYGFALIYFFILFNESGTEFINSVQNVESQGLSFKYFIFNWILNAQLLTYFIYILFLLKKYSCSIKELFSSLEKVRLDWLVKITYMGISVICIFLIENIMFLIGINLSNYFNLSSLMAGIYVYGLGYLGLSKSEIFSDPNINASIKEWPNYCDYKQRNEREKISRISQKYEKSGLTPERAKEYLGNLLNLMERYKPYTESNLTLNQLAQKLNISPHNLSEVINTQLNQNFFDFINQYRVEEVKRDLFDPKKQHYKILSLALEAGFNSKTSFNTIFKKYTNTTPSEYRKNVLKKTNSPDQSSSVKHN